MIDAQERQESQNGTNCSLRQQSTSQEMSAGGNKNRTFIPSINILQDAEEYVNVVMSSQQVSAVLRTPLPSGRKRHLSMPAVGESELKKIRSDDVRESDAELELLGETNIKTTNRENDDNGKIKRNSVRARRNLLKGKTCPSISKKKSVNSENKDIQDRQNQVKNKPSNKKNIATKNYTKKQREKETVNQTSTAGEANENVSTGSETAETQKDMPAILNAIGAMETRMNKQFTEMKANNESIFKHVQKEIVNIKDDFNKRMDGLAKKIETKICESLNRKVDQKFNKYEKQMNSKTKDLQQSIQSLQENVKHLEETVIPTINEKLGDEIDEVTQKYDRIVSYRQDVTTNNNIIIRNLPERENENIVREVNNILREGLKLREIMVEVAERKQSRLDDRKPGIIVAKCGTREDKQTVMKCKRILRDSRRYEKVFIENDLPKHQRVLNSNLRTIVNTIGNDKLKLKGSRVSVTETEERERQHRLSDRDRNDSQRNRNYDHRGERERRDQPRRDRQFDLSSYRYRNSYEYGRRHDYDNSSTTYGRNVSERSEHIDNNYRQKRDHHRY